MRKYNTAKATYTGHKGETTITAIWERIPAELKDRCTGKELGMIMDAINKAYHDGKASAGAEKLDNESVYIDGVGIRTFDSLQAG